MINYDLTKIRLLAFDVDGVLSASVVPIGADGQPTRTANIKDGYAIHYAMSKGLEIAIITGGNNDRVARRFLDLGCREVHMGCGRKRDVYEALLEKYSLRDENVLYMGDDIPDLEIMQHCGVPCCPKDAVPEIRNVALYISHLAGGEGCGRDVIEQVMRAQGTWLSGNEAYCW